MNILTRRELLLQSAIVAGTLCVGRLLRADNDKPVKLLFFTKSSGYQHDVIDRHGQHGFAYAEQILVDLGRAKGFDVTPSKDGSLFTPDRLAAFDGFVFYTTGDLTQSGTDHQPPMPAGGKQALLKAVAGGKGFVGIHSATDTFHSHGDTVDPYITMLGGEFITHGSQQDSTSHVVDTKFPGAPDSDFMLHEEWYAIKNYAADLHAVLLQETKNMQGVMYRRNPYPSTWAKPYGKGKVFYTSMGHGEPVWKNPIFTDLLMGGISWTTNKSAAIIPPNYDPANTADLHP